MVCLGDLAHSKSRDCSPLAMPPSSIPEEFACGQRSTTNIFGLDSRAHIRWQFGKLGNFSQPHLYCSKLHRQSFFNLCRCGKKEHKSNVVAQFNVKKSDVEQLVEKRNWALMRVDYRRSQPNRQGHITQINITRRALVPLITPIAARFNQHRKAGTVGAQRFKLRLLHGG
jgi:hypothetical protein